jgi:hypothetical protein
VLAHHIGKQRSLALQRAEALRLVLRAALSRDLRVGAPEEGVVLADVDRQRRRLAVEARAAVELQRRPGTESAGGGAGEAHRIPRQIVRLAREDSRRLVLSVPVAGSAGEDGDDHVRPEGAHHRHHILENRVARPVTEGLLGALGEAEVVGAGEELPPAVDAPGGEQLLGADDAERLPQLVADQVLPPVAAGEREVGRLDAAAARQPGDEVGVLVVRVRGDHQHPRGGAELLDPLAQCGRAALLREGGARRGDEQQGCKREE